MLKRLVSGLSPSLNFSSIFPLKISLLKSVPVKSVPVKSVPVKSVPLKSVPVKSVPLTIFPLTLLITGLSVKTVSAQSRPYNPIPLEIGREITDTLSNQDVPTGQGGFSRDYIINLKAGEQVSIEAKSQAFDSIVSLIAPGGTTLGENDDGPDGTENSLLFARVVKSANYVVRVRSFGEKPGGIFTLKIMRLRSE